MRILFLDDNKERHEYFREITIGQDVTYVWNARECMDALLTNEAFDLACLDHDLAGAYFQDDKANSGTEVAEFIRDALPPIKYPKKIICHSWNPQGAERMYNLISSVGINVVKIPYKI